MRSLGFAALALLITGAAACRPPASTPAPVVIATSYGLPSRILQQNRRINVYLPPGYTEGTARYPVLYLLDGGIAEDFLHIAGIASLAADFRNLREFILVGIEGIDRYHDLTYPTTVASERERLPTSGGAVIFRTFLRDELIPFVEQHFRVTDESVLMGESAAGMFVVETLLREPALFTGYIAVSPMLWWDRQSLVRQADRLLQIPFTGKRRLYLTIADEGGDMRAGVDILVEALKGHAPPNLAWKFDPRENETHGTTFHPAALTAIRAFFSADSDNRAIHHD